MKTEIKRFLLVNARPEKVWQALTDPRELNQWVSQSAEVDPRVGGSYLLRAPWLFREGIERGTIRTWQAPEKLGAQWIIHGVPTQLELKLERQLDLTRLHLHHTIPNEVDRVVSALNVCGDEMLDHFWGLYLGMLKRYIETGSALDHSRLLDKPSDEVRHEMVVPVSPEAAFRSLTEKKGLEGWIASDASVDLQVGGRFSYGWKAEGAGKYGPEKVVSLVPGREIAFSWNADGMPSVVKWTIETAAGNQAKIKLVHSGFAGRSESIFRDYNEGWFSLMINLDVYLRTGQGADEWKGTMY